ncbi:MAG: HAD-IA family hydrolase [Nitrospiria bacterium]
MENVSGGTSGSRLGLVASRTAGPIEIDLLIFDLDGTLADTKEDIATAVNLTLSDYGLPPHPPQQIYTFVGDGVRALLARAFESRGADVFADALAVFRGHYLDHLVDATRLYPGVETVLDHFAPKKKAIVTNKPIEYTLKLMDGLKARERFDVILGANSTPHLKPHPGMIHQVLSDLGVSPGRAIMVGDNVNDILAARGAGVRSVAVGYGLGDPAVLRAAHPDFFCERIEELMTLFH